MLVTYSRYLVGNLNLNSRGIQKHIYQKDVFMYLGGDFINLPKIKVYYTGKQLYELNTIIYNYYIPKKGV